MKPRGLAILLVLFAAGTAFLLISLPNATHSASRPSVQPVDAELQQIRNLGKSFYENPGSANQAVDELKKALDRNPNSAREHLNYGLSLLRAGQNEEGIAEIVKARGIDPKIPHTYFNLGIEYKKLGETEKAIAEFEQMRKLVPGEPKTHYNLGVLYKLQGDNEKAVASFEKAAELDPSLAAPHFQLYNMYRRDDRDRASKELERFKALKDLQADAAVGEDIDWSFYSELYDPVAPVPPADGPSAITFDGSNIEGALNGAGHGVAALDANADGRVDLLAWSSSGAMLLLNEETGFRRQSSDSLDALDGIRTTAVGDFNNDGFPDLAVSGQTGVQLLSNDNGSLGAPDTLVQGDFQALLWVDFDHDNDLDLLAAGGEQKLLRNNGDGTFLDVSADFPFAGKGRALAASWAELEEDNGYDILVAYSGGLVHYEDRKIGHYNAIEVSGVTPAGKTARLDTGDWNNDGFLDFALTSGDGDNTRTRIIENYASSLSAGPEINGVLAWADFANRGWADAAGVGRIESNRGEMEFAPAESRGLPSGMAAAATADFDSDGKADLATIDSGGAIHVLRNTTETKNAWLAVALEGVKSRKLAEGARVEIKSGNLYRKQVYNGVPLVFGLAGATSIDTVRITWPNGLIQNEFDQLPGQARRYDEKPRLSGSCPMIFTWNGKEFEFISDVLGVAPLGAGLADGQFFPVDHDEYVWISGGQLRETDGVYKVRVTEELREVSYLDQIKLVAVDHPVGTDVYTNEKFVGPPFPEFRLYGVSQEHLPAAAADNEGRDVLPRLKAIDQTYPDAFRRDFSGRAETHSLTLDFPTLKGRDDVVLFLNGWVDWADGSTFIAASQSAKHALFAPYLQVRDAQGDWKTVIEDMGMPAGKPKTIAVDLTAKFLSDSREVRIVTNMCVYWDRVFAAAGAAQPRVTLTGRVPARAALRFRGFSDVTVHPERRQPEQFHYARVKPVSLWNPTKGLYTRFGSVGDLLGQSDDRMVIMGSGDELALEFSAAGMPPLPAGWRRDFLLYFDGWAKDADANTAFGQSVEPLPFHAMSQYPYPATEGFPRGGRHREYLREYNTRPALRLIRPLR